jgi:hypothetical protein
MIPDGSGSQDLCVCRLDANSLADHEKERQGAKETNVFFHATSLQNKSLLGVFIYDAKSDMDP